MKILKLYALLHCKGSDSDKDAYLNKMLHSKDNDAQRKDRLIMKLLALASWDMFFIMPDISNVDIIYTGLREVP